MADSEFFKFNLIFILVESCCETKLKKTMVNVMNALGFNVHSKYEIRSSKDSSVSQRKCPYMRGVPFCCMFLNMGKL